MLTHVAIKKDRFEATLRYLIADSVQAFKDPLMIGNTPFYLEGARVNSVQLSLAPQERTVTVNLSGGGGVVAAPGLSPITYRMLQVQVDMDVFLISESSMKAANFNPPADVADIPLRGIDFWLYVEVEPSGTPRIHLQPYPGQADITGRFAVDAPLPLAQALGALGGGGAGKVLNAGIHLAKDGNVVMRVETEAQPLPFPRQRWVDWSN